MKLGEWQAKLIEQPGQYGAALYLWRHLHGATEFLQAEGTVKTRKESEAADARDLAFAFLEGEQLQAIADAFSNFGIKTPNDHKVAGFLEAKDAHLQDMRALVFKGKQQV